MDLDNLDVISISADDMYELLRWRDNSMEFLNNYKPMIKEGYIDVTGISTIHFNFVSDKVTEYELFCNNMHCASIRLTRQADDYIVEKCMLDEEYKLALTESGIVIDAEQMIGDICTLVITCMAYMEHCSDDVISEVIYNNKNIERSRNNAEIKHAKLVKLTKAVYRFFNIKENADMQESINAVKQMELNKFGKKHKKSEVCFDDVQEAITNM